MGPEHDIELIWHHQDSAQIVPNEVGGHVTLPRNFYGWGAWMWGDQMKFIWRNGNQLKKWGSNPWYHQQWRRQGGMGGSGPLISVQTPPEICENPLRNVLYMGGSHNRGVPYMYIVTFHCSPAKKNCSDPQFFWAGDATDHQKFEHCVRVMML